MKLFIIALIFMLSGCYSTGLDINMKAGTITPIHSSTGCLNLQRQEVPCSEIEVEKK